MRRSDRRRAPAASPPRPMRELEQLGPAAGPDARRVGHIGFAGSAARGARGGRDAWCTRSARPELGRLQLGWARAAGAEVRPGAPATDLDLAGRTVAAGGRSDSVAPSDRRRRGGLRRPPGARPVRAARVLRRPSTTSRALRLEPLRIECDPGAAGERLLLGLSSQGLRLARRRGPQASGRPGRAAPLPRRAAGRGSAYLAAACSIRGRDDRGGVPRQPFSRWRAPGRRRGRRRLVIHRGRHLCGDRHRRGGRPTRSSIPARRRPRPSDGCGPSGVMTGWPAGSPGRDRAPGRSAPSRGSPPARPPADRSPGWCLNP